MEIHLPDGDFEWVPVNTNLGQLVGGFQKATGKTIAVDSPNAIWIRKTN
jgi:hypothetical protein